MKIRVAKPQKRKREVRNRKPGAAGTVTVQEWYARVDYFDDDGKFRSIYRRAKDKAEAQDKVRKFVQELTQHGKPILDADHLTFADVAREYEELKLVEPRYVDGQKVAGLRTYQVQKLYLATLVDYFGRKGIKNITHADVDRFRITRLDTETTRETPRKIASVNRELETLRAVLNFALQQGWITKNPFKAGPTLILKSAEVHRDRVLSFEEEARLLAACTGKRSHLKPLLITAMDTAMRRGELFKLKWRHVNLVSGMIHVEAMNSKTMRPRDVPMTGRVMRELRELFETSKNDPDDRVFGITDTIKTGFKSACQAAGIADFRFHDARHTATTRMIAAGIPPAEVMKITGHTQMITFLRYLNPTTERKRTVADILDNYLQTQADQAEKDTEGVVN